MLLSSYTTRHAGWDLYLPLHNLLSTFSVYARHFDEQILHSTGVDYSCNCVYGLNSVKTWCLGVSTCATCRVLNTCNMTLKPQKYVFLTVLWTAGKEARKLLGFHVSWCMTTSTSKSWGSWYHLILFDWCFDISLGYLNVKYYFCDVIKKTLSFWRSPTKLHVSAIVLLLVRQLSKFRIFDQTFIVLGSPKEWSIPNSCQSAVMEKLISFIKEHIAVWCCCMCPKNCWNTMNACRNCTKNLIATYQGAWCTLNELSKNSHRHEGQQRICTAGITELTPLQRPSLSLKMISLGLNHPLQTNKEKTSPPNRPTTLESLLSLVFQQSLTSGSRLRCPLRACLESCDQVKVCEIHSQWWSFNYPTTNSR